MHSPGGGKRLFVCSLTGRPCRLHTHTPRVKQRTHPRSETHDQKRRRASRARRSTPPATSDCAPCSTTRSGSPATRRPPRWSRRAPRAACLRRRRATRLTPSRRACRCAHGGFEACMGLNGAWACEGRMCFECSRESLRGDPELTKHAEALTVATAPCSDCPDSLPPTQWRRGRPSCTPSPST